MTDDVTVPFWLAVLYGPVCTGLGLLAYRWGAVWGRWRKRHVCTFSSPCGVREDCRG